MSTPTPGADAIRERWRTTMTAGPDCLPLDRLIAPELNAPDQTHVAACARCRTERALAQAFDASVPAPDEGAAVAWIVSETRRRVFADETGAAAAAPRVRRPVWTGWMTWASAALAAGLGIALIVGTATPPPSSVEPEPAYRSAAVALVAPVGEVPGVPGELRWQPLAGVARYTVSVREVDGTEIWRTTTSDTMVALPDDVRAAIKPARTLTWRVDPLDAAGTATGEPATASFRLRP